MRILFIICVVFAELAYAQGPSTMFWTLNQNQFLLDQLNTTSVSAAYSVRKLKRTYNGYAMRVRRSSDNAIGDLAFDASGVISANSNITISSTGAGSLTLGAVYKFNTFFSGTSVYVLTWYDQSVNARHVTQATSANQPRIVNAGSLELANTKPSIRFINANSTVLQCTVPVATMFPSGYLGTVALVLEASSGTTSAFGFSDGAMNRWQAHMNESGNLYFDVGSSYNRLLYNNTANIGLLRNYVLVSGASSMQIWLGGTNVASSSFTMSACTTGVFNIGGIPLFPGTWYHDNHQSELIAFPKALSSTEISIVQASQKTFYGTP